MADKDYDLKEFNQMFSQNLKADKLMADTEKEQRLLSSDEIFTLTQALRSGRNSDVSDEDIGRLINWALQIRVETIFLDMILNGDANVNILPNGEIEFIERE